MRGPTGKPLGLLQQDFYTQDDTPVSEPINSFKALKHQSQQLYQTFQPLVTALQ